MKIPSKKYIENICERHCGRKVKVKRTASSVLFLRYMIFLKKLANEADNSAFRQRRRLVKVGDVIQAERIVGNVSEMEKIRTQVRSKQRGHDVDRSSSTGSVNTRIESDADDLDLEKENDRPDSEPSS